MYLPSDDGAEAFARIALPAQASVSVAPAIDPNWTLFADAAPTGMEEQSMFDYRLRNALHAAGDVGGIRRVEHGVTGLDPARIEDFGVAVESVGVTVGGASGERIELVQEVDPKDITEFSWTVRLIAERFGGTYDGWSCAPLTASEPSTPGPRRRRRRRFRRS